MRNTALLMLALLAGCTAKTPAVHMRFVDDADGRPIAGAQVVFCGTAWQGTLTGHGGAGATLFKIEAVTDAKGEINLAPKEFDARPFGMNTNYDHATMRVGKPGYAPQHLINSGVALGSFEAAGKWAYHGATIRMKRAAGGETAAAKFDTGCGQERMTLPDPRLLPQPPTVILKPANAPTPPVVLERSAAPAAGYRYAPVVFPFFDSARPSSSLESFTFLTLVGLTFSVSTFSFLTLTFSFFTTGPAAASFAARLIFLASTSSCLLIFWCLRLAFNIDAWLMAISCGYVRNFAIVCTDFAECAETMRTRNRCIYSFGRTNFEYVTASPLPTGRWVHGTVDVVAGLVRRR
jgi:hypothetical protein